jgi:hypothetical protein
MIPKISERDRGRSVLAACGVFLFWVSAQAAPQPVHPSVQVRHLLNAEAGSRPIRIVKDPRDNALYYLKESGSIYRITVNPGTNTSTSVRILGSEHHTVSSAAGMAIGPEGTMYVVGNTSTNNGNSTFATIMKGGDERGERADVVGAGATQPYPRSRTAFDHVFNGILASQDGQFVYVNSGSRTDHGEVQSVNDLFPNYARGSADGEDFSDSRPARRNLVLTNDIAVLRSAGFVFAEGVRNTYDLAFAPNGDLFGTENGPDRDMSEELNWLRPGTALRVSVADRRDGQSAAVSQL